MVYNGPSGGCKACRTRRVKECVSHLVNFLHILTKYSATRQNQHAIIVFEGSSFARVMLMSSTAHIDRRTILSFGAWQNKKVQPQIPKTIKANPGKPVLQEVLLKLAQLHRHRHRQHQVQTDPRFNGSSTLQERHRHRHHPRLVLTSHKTRMKPLYHSLLTGVLTGYQPSSREL